MATVKSFIKLPFAEICLCLCSCKSARETNMEKRRGRRPQDARTDGRTESAETENAERNRSDAPDAQGSDRSQGRGRSNRAREKRATSGMRDDVEEIEKREKNIEQRERL